MSSRISTHISPNPTVTDKRRMSQSRLALLMSVFLILAFLLPISRRYLQSKPPSPPANADLLTVKRFYAKRIVADPSDVQAYVELGKLDEASGYYTEALRHLLPARELGASEKDIAAPIGRALIFLAHYDEARTELEKSVLHMPDNLSIRLTLAGLFDAVGKPEEASRTLKSFIEKHPSLESVSASSKEVSQLMLFFHQIGDDTMAARMAADIIRLSQDKAEAYAVSGQIALQRHEVKAAVNALEKASQLSPKDPSLHYTYGLALGFDKREDEALRQWQMVIALDPNAVEAYKRLGEIYIKRKDYHHAAIACQKIALREPDNLLVVRMTASTLEKAGQHIPAVYWRSVEARLLKDYPRAIRLADEAAREPVWRKRGLGSKAECYRDQQKTKEYLAAIMQMTSAHTAEDDIALAKAYGLADQLKEQTSLLKSALGKNPKNPADVHLQLSDVALRKGLRDEAETELVQAKTIEPNNPLYHLELGKLYYERRNTGDRLKRALREFTLYTQLDPSEVVGYQKLGIAYAAAGDLQRAGHNLEHALDLLPGDGATYQELGRVYARLGDKQESERMLMLYRKYVTLDLQRQTLVTKSKSAEKDPSTQIALAEFFEKTEDYKTAASYYNRAAAMIPSDKSIQAKAKRLSLMLGHGSN